MQFPGAVENARFEGGVKTRTVPLHCANAEVYD